MSVHTLACYPLATYGTDEQQRPLAAGPARRRAARGVLPVRAAVGLGRRRAVDPGGARREGDDYVVTGTKAWITHGGVADFYNLMVRTSDDGPAGITCLLAEASTPGLSAAPPERKMAAGAQPHGADPARRRPGPGRAADRRRRARASRSRWPPWTQRSARHRRLRGRPGPGRAGRRRRLREGAPPVRPARSRTSRACSSCSPTWPPQVAAARELYLAAARRRDRGQAVRLAGGDGQAVRHRHGDAGDHRRGPGPRRLRLRRGLPASSATCARPRCCRSSRAPTRSSGSSSPEVCWLIG